VSSSVQLVASMRQAMLEFTGGNLIDDVTMLVLRAGRLAQRHGSGTKPEGKHAGSSAGPS